MSTDLDWLLDPEVKSLGKTKAQKRREEKARRSKELQVKMAEVEEAFHQAVENMALWEPVALVQILYEVTCSCGEYAEIPEVFPRGVPPSPLVRFKHKRSGQLWEKRVKPHSLPAGLPRTVRLIPATSSYCAWCLSLEERGEASLSPSQLSLFGDLS